MSDMGTGGTPAESGDKTILIKNATVLDYFPVAMDAEASPRVERVDLRIVGERIVERAAAIEPGPKDQIILKIDGVPKFYGFPGIIKGNRAVEITRCLNH